MVSDVLAVDTNLWLLIPNRDCGVVSVAASDISFPEYFISPHWSGRPPPTFEICCNQVKVPPFLDFLCEEISPRLLFRCLPGKYLFFLPPPMRKGQRGLKLWKHSYIFYVVCNCSLCVTIWGKQTLFLVITFYNTWSIRLHSLDGICL